MSDQPIVSSNLALAGIPQLGLLLVEKGQLSETSREQLQAGYAAHPGMVVGELIVALKLPNEQTNQPFTKQEIDAVLHEQVVRKMKAAVTDIASIAQSGAHAIPPWLKANWGNRGVNKAPENPSVTDGVSAVANIAQNLVLTANNARNAAELATQYAAAIDAAQKLVMSMAVNSNYRATREQIGGFLTTLSQALGTVPAPLKSSQGEHDITMQDYATQRSKEIRGALRQLGLEPPAPGIPR